MCIIVDANVAANLCRQQLTPDAKAVVDWIEKRGGRIVHGGKLTDELTANSRVSRWLRSLSQAGRAIQVSAATVAAEVVRIQQSAQCASNDAHIIALARVSGARLLYSHDHDLHTDFTNPALVSQPRGSVYQNVTHRRLLSIAVCQP
jgi:predicted nucleic acid-binding protein